MRKKHYGKFKVRLYMYSQNIIDRYTLMFPYPKWLIEHETKARGGYPVHGFCISCNQASDGTVLRCASFEYIRWKTYLGARVSLEKMSPVFQQWARTLEILWQEALEYDDEEHWHNWNVA